MHVRKQDRRPKSRQEDGVHHRQRTSAPSLNERSNGTRSAVVLLADGLPAGRDPACKLSASFLNSVLSSWRLGGNSPTSPFWRLGCMWWRSSTTKGTCRTKAGPAAHAGELASERSISGALLFLIGGTWNVHNSPLGPARHPGPRTFHACPEPGEKASPSSPRAQGASGLHSSGMAAAFPTESPLPMPSDTVIWLVCAG